MRIKKFLTFLLTLAMVVSMLPAAAFAANNTATTMRLAKTQGAVAVTNVTGKKVTQTSNMKLYNGYKIRTGAKSYAWISLDDTKAAKLDANSVVSVQKSGQKLTLYLSSGNLFFHVKEKLSGGESFHIKTSTMTTGIRGTSGCVRIINPRVTEIHLLTGQIEVYTENPELYISKTAVLKAGQKATSLIAEDAVAATGEQADIIIEKLQHEEVCGNCSKEIAADPALVERIEEEAPHLLPEKIADEADERLKVDEEAAEEKQEAIEKAVDEQTLPEDVDPYFEKEDAGGSGGGGGGSSAPSAPVTPSTVVQVSTWGELVQAVNDYNAGTEDITIEVMAEIDQGTETTTVTVNPTANSNTLTIDLTTEGINMNSTIVNNGNLVVTNTAGHIITEAVTVVENNGTFTLDDGTLQTVDFEHGVAVVNNGDFEMIGGRIMGSYDNNHEFASYCGVMNEGTFTMSAGTIDTVGYAIINGENAAADLTILGGDVAPLLGVQNINGTATVTDGTLDGTFYNEDELIIQGGIWTASYGAIVKNENTGTLTMDGGTMQVRVANGYGVNNSGTATISDGDIYVNVGATNSVGVASSGTLLLEDGARVRAYDGTGVNGTGGLVTLDTGAAVFAYNEAWAVNLSGTTLARPIRANVSAEHFIDENDQKVMNPYDQYMDVMVLDSPNGDRMYQLKDNWGQPVTSTVNTWADLVAAVEAFNLLDGSGETVTLKLGADIPTATETNPATMNSIASGNKHLVIDLNNHDLALPQTVTVGGNLELVGGGVITGTGTKLFEVPSTGSIEMNSNTSGAPTIALKQGQIAINSTQSSVYMNAGQILLNETRITGIYSTDGYVYMTGGEIVLVKYEDGWANIGIQAMSGAEVIMSGGTIREDDGIKDVETALDDNYAIYANGSTVALTGGTVSVHNGTAIGVTDPSQLTLGSAVVTGKDAAKLLVTDNDDETGFITSVYNAPYFQLQNDVPGINTWTEFETAVAAFNAGTINTIELAGNVDPTPTEAAAAEAAGSLVIGDTSAAALTIDLNGYTLALPTLLETGSGLDLVIDGSGGQIIVDDDWNAGFLMGGVMIENYADLTLKNGTMVVSDGLTGVMIGSNVLTLGDNSTLRVDNGTGVDNDTGSMSMSSSASIIVNSGTGVINFNNPFTMNGGTITADGTGSTGVNAVRTDLVSGEITATDGAAAVSSSQEPLALGNGMIVRADDAAKVYVVTGGGTLVNYESVDGGDGYYYLKAIN